MKVTDVNERWENYRKANSSKPNARGNELKRIFLLVNPKEGNKILEVGTGNGYLTFPLAEAVGTSGQVVTTDVSKGNIEDVIEKNKVKGLNLVPTLLPFKEGTLSDPKYNNYFDVVTTIATFHHFDNRLDGTGDSGRRAALKQFYKNLKSGGRLVIGDVLHGTISQKYFDAVDNPIHCSPFGHPHDFFDENSLKKAVEDVGFKDVNVTVEYVPWKFASEEEAGTFIHTIHNAKCTLQESLDLAKEKLGLKKVGDHYELGWELFFLQAIK